MAELDLTAAIEAARHAVDDTIDTIEQRNDGLPFNGLFDAEVNEIAEAAVRAAAELIVADTRRQIAEERAAEVERWRRVLDDLTDPDPCWFDHHGGCQAHGFISLRPGEQCPQAEAKELLADAAIARGSGGDETARQQ